MSLFKEIEQKPLEYIALAVAMSIGVVIYFFTQSQHFAIFFIAGAYFLWSLYHHYRRGDLHLSIVIEYLVLILFALVVLMSNF
jgi:hypothetical protein